MEIISGKNTLSAIYDKGTNGQAILMIHGFALDKHEVGVFDALAKGFHENGYSILRFDLPGMGESSGSLETIQFSDMVKAVHDCFKFLKQEHASVSILAASFGNACALAEHLPWKAVISLNPTVFGKESWEHLFTLAAKNGWLKDYEEGKAVTMKNGVVVGAHMIDALKGLRLIDFVKDLKTPFLLFHGSADQYIPIEHAQKLFDAVPSKKEFIILEGARHGFRRPPFIERILQESLRWLRL